jgi:hypothetical protein
MPLNMQIQPGVDPVLHIPQPSLAKALSGSVLGFQVFLLNLLFLITLKPLYAGQTFHFST